MNISIFYHHLEEAAQQTGRPLDEILSAAENAGISGVECDIGYIRDNPLRFRESLSHVGIKVSSVYSTIDYSGGYRREESLRFLDASATSGSDKVLIIPGFALSEDKDYTAKLEAMQCGVARLCEDASNYGITVTMEDFDAIEAPYRSSDGLLGFLSKTDKLRIAFDTGNFAFGNEDELAAFDKLSPFIAHVHCKDRALSGEDTTPLKTQHGKLLYSSPVGSGFIRMDEIIKRLKNSSYDGWYAIEHFGAPDQLTYMKRSADWLKERLL